MSNNIYNIKKENRVNLLRYASHVACLHVLSACAGAQNPVSALNSNASSLPPLQCDHFVTGACNQDRHKESEYEDILLS